MIYMAVHVFGYNLSDALGYLDPNIEDKVKNYKNSYNNIFYTMNEDIYMRLPELLDYIKINGSSHKLLKNIIIALDYTSDIDETLHLEKVLSLKDLIFIYESLPETSMLRFLIYPLIFNERSRELEELFKFVNVRRACILYQYYWLKFMKGEGDARLFGYPIYMDNYKGLIQTEENKYVQSFEYLRTRLRNDPKHWSY
jgi:hypothetical protein